MWGLEGERSSLIGDRRGGGRKDIQGEGRVCVARAGKECVDIIKRVSNILCIYSRLQISVLFCKHLVLLGEVCELLFL